MSKKSPVITILDIETASIQAHVWGLYDQNIGLNMIKEDWRVLSFASKVYQEPEVFYIEARKPEDERKMLREIWRVLDESDIIVAHNGKRFDIKKLNARFIQHKFRPYSPVRIVDTLIEARGIGAFTSNKLEYLTGLLCTEKKMAHAKFPGFKLWSECLAGNPEAWDEMREYNVQDIVALEELYTILRPWMTNHPNVGTYTWNPTPTCRNCGSTNVQKRGTSRTNIGTYQRYRCNDCGTWSRDRKIQTPAKERQHIIVR